MVCGVSEIRTSCVSACIWSDRIHADSTRQSLKKLLFVFINIFLLIRKRTRTCVRCVEIMPRVEIPLHFNLTQEAYEMQHNGRSSDLLSGHQHLPESFLSGFCWCRQGQLTAAGLSGICTRFPFHRPSRGEPIAAAKVTKKAELMILK